MLVNPSLILGLIHNIALLLATSLLFDFFWTQQEGEQQFWNKIFTGIFMGVIGVVLMLTPWVLVPGLVFDTRSILLGISGLFFGPVPTFIAILITGVYRLFLGGDGQWMGLAVIISSGTIGLLWRRFRPGWNQKRRIAELYVLGLVIHVAMLVCTLLLPVGSVEYTVRTIALPVLIIYPLGTLLLGLLMFSRSHHWKIKRELFQSEEKFRQMFENSEAVMMLVDPESGRLVEANHAAARFYGYSIEELTRKNVQEINTLSPDEAIEVRRKALSSESTCFVIQHQLANREIRTVEIHSSPITFQGQTVLFSIIHDISERKLAEDALIEAKEKAEESDKLKSAFLATMSHELRTPLNAIIGFSSVMEEENDPVEMKQYAGIINSSGNHLLSIIESIFDVALLQSGEYKVNKTQFSVEDFFQPLIDYANVEKIKRNKDHLDVIAIFPHGIKPPIIHSDRGKLMQLMTNLLNNAIKYTKQGRIEFGFSVHDRDITFYVSDTGIGIPASIVDIIFDQFRQGDENHTRVHDGVGLGLAICKEIACLLNGKIWLETSENEGSTFHCTLYDVLVEENHPEQSVSGLLNPINLTGKTILVVDDMEENIYLLKKFLHSTRATLLDANSGESAIRQIMENPGIDLVYMDIKMPGMDGYEAIHELLKIRPGLDIIAQTAHAVKGVKEKIKEAGCIGYISKPIKREEIYRGLADLFGS